MTFHIAALAGDGIGPEIVSEAIRVLHTAAERFGFSIGVTEALVGGIAYDATGRPLPPETLALCRRSDAILLGAVGGPKWDSVQPPSLRPEVGALLPLRKELGLFANLRPARLFPALADVSSLRADIVGEGLDILVVRELTGGIYFGEPKGRDADGRRAVDTCVYTREEIERIARIGFLAAQGRGKRLCSVDKANVLETSRLWREVVISVWADYPDVELSHMLVDNCAMQLVRNPRQFDVIVTENMFGDILSDEASMLTGSLGMLPSASLGETPTAGGRASSACTSRSTAPHRTSRARESPTRSRRSFRRPCSCGIRSGWRRRRPALSGQFPRCSMPATARRISSRPAPRRSAPGRWRSTSLMR